MARIVGAPKSVIPSADVDTIDSFRELVKQTHNVKGIGGYKVGAMLGLKYGLPEIVRVLREYSTLPVIYDHQKGMTDIPEFGSEMLKVIKDAGINAFIGFPQSGPETEETWIKAAKGIGLEVIIGGEMTHPKYKQSEGGYIADEALDRMYLTAAKLGVTNFVVPGNKADRVKYYRGILEPVVGDQLSLWAPGFVAQGGKISDAAVAAGRSFHAIVGRGIYKAADMHAAAVEMTSQLGV